MASPREQLACLTLVLSLLCPGAHRATKRDLLLSVVGDEQQAHVHEQRPLVHNVCKNVGRVACTHLHRKTCFWDWDETAMKFRCLPRFCTHLFESDCLELPKYCKWNWDVDNGIGSCHPRPAANGFENPCKDLEADDCKLESQHCKWLKKKCTPNSCAGIMGSDCQELKSQCIWKTNTLTHEQECMDLPKDNPCKNLDSVQCMRNDALCAWDEDHTTSKGNCRPKTCSGIKESDCQELTGHCIWIWFNKTESGRCLDRPPAIDHGNACKYAKAECHFRSDVCTWDIDPLTTIGRCRPKTCRGIKGSSCILLLDMCYWKWDQEKQTGECLPESEGPRPPRRNPCKDLEVNDCRDKDDDCTWDFNMTAMSHYCRPKTCDSIKHVDCEELTNQCTWIPARGAFNGDCRSKLEVNLTTKTTTTVAKYRDNPCRGHNVCRLHLEDCSWTSIGRCRPKTCAHIKDSHCKELQGQCEWEWNATSETGECLDLDLPPLPKAHTKAALKDNPCKNLTGHECRGKAWQCAYDFNARTSTGNCRPRTCAGIKGSDCKELSSQCTWKWDGNTTGECLDLLKAPTTCTTTIAKAKDNDNPCKNLTGSACKNTTMSEHCVWDWDKETSTGNCRPKTCAGIKSTDCKELPTQCIWKWDHGWRTGECLDLPKAKLKDNPCRNLKGSDCRNATMSEHCAWDWDKETAAGKCRPKTCAGIKSSDCMYLTSQCIYHWDQDTQTGQCLDRPKATTTSTTTTAKKLKGNPCKNLKGSDCKNTTMSEHCAWDWDKQTLTGNCRPKTCAGIAFPECKELISQCTWKWGRVCVDLPRRARTTSTSTSTTTTAKVELKDNPCKNLKGSDCRDKSEYCAWDWNEETSTGNCRPLTCAGIQARDCRQLSTQCTWEWDSSSLTGKCLPKAVTPKPEFKDNPCKDLKDSSCKAKSEECAWDWDKQTSTGNCRPRTCAGIKGSDCRELTSQCGWRWDPISQSGECLDIPKAAAVTTTTAERGMADPCKNLGQPACGADDDVCNWDPLAKSCKPKTCVGLRGSDCRGLPHHCVWQWKEDLHTGQCLDIVPPTTTTTINAGGRAAWFVSSLLVSVLVTMGPL